MKFKNKFAHKSNYGSARPLSNIKYIVIHFTGNKGDTALNNCKYFQSANRHASAHCFVDGSGTEYAITSNGAAIYHIPTSTCLHEYKMTPASVECIIQITKQHETALEVFIDGKAYALKAYVEDPVSYGTTPQAIPYIQSTRIPIDDIISFIREHIDHIDSMDIVVSGEQQKQLIWNELKYNCDEIYITSSVSQLIEISHKDAGKHSGLRFIREYLNLKHEETAAFGDGDNDIDLLKEAGIGIAIENASSKCKDAATFITKHHDKDGVAYGITEFLKI